MEFKVRKESESLIEKIFRNHERRGVVRSYQMAMLLRSLSPEIQYNEDELKEIVAKNDEGTGTLDLDGFSKVTLHFLLKQRRRESNDFSHKQLIGIGDFADA